MKDDVTSDTPGRAARAQRAQIGRGGTASLIDDCVHCGFCLPACPTYSLWGEEADSPRGRIYLMKLATEGHVGLTSEFVRHFDSCLGCMACEPACPSGVQYGKLIEATRATIEDGHRRTLSDRLFRALLFALMPHPRRLALLRPALWLYQRAGLRTVARRMGLLSLVPRRLRALETLAPNVDFDLPRVDRVTPARGTSRGRVGLLLGCVQRSFFAGVNAATARALAAEGFTVVAPEDQGCCGALYLHAGRERDAELCARRLIDTFDREEVDAVAVNAAGCGSTLAQYGYLLRDDPAYAARAQSFAARCKDVSVILASEGPRSELHGLPMRVAYHDACHLRNAQRVVDAPREVLSRIPGLEVVEIGEGAVCCGSAGVYNLLEPATAGELGDRKAVNIAATRADAVVTGNPGCALQIRAALERAGRALPVLHLVEVVDASQRGVSVERTLDRGR
jgi:glycolate oxidase iron-sulfur subunit